MRKKVYSRQELIDMWYDDKYFVNASAEDIANLEEGDYECLLDTECPNMKWEGTVIIKTFKPIQK